MKKSDCPSHGDYAGGKRFNSLTGKWVKNLRPSNKGGTDVEKWKRLGSPEKNLVIPVNTDIEKVKTIAITYKVNYQHLLFILHKLLYNRIMFRKQDRNKKDYFNNYTSLGSKDLYKWIGKDYVKCLSALHEIEYIMPKLNDRGNKSYYNVANHFGNTSAFKINPKLFNYDLFEHPIFFKTFPLTDKKLIVKLTRQHLRNIKSSHPVHALLCKAMHGVKVKPQTDILNQNHLHETVQEMLLLIEQINNQEIYVKPEFDSYGERFHSTFTFTWSSLRPLIYFENKPGKTVYLDLKNSQYFFFSLLALPQVYQLIPEYLPLQRLMERYSAEMAEFNSNCHAGTLYSWCEQQYGLTKLNLMKIFFGKSKQFKHLRKKLPWLEILIKEIEQIYGTNILPAVLQKLESRSLLHNVSYTFLKKNPTANLISIHDGLLFGEEYLTEMINTINVFFSSLNLPVPKFKI